MTRVGSVLFAVAAAFALVGPMAAGRAMADGQGAVEVSGPARVSDGDTLRIGDETLRLFGIDAPEDGQSCARADGSAWPCSDHARAALAALIGAAPVTCEGIERDRYDRLVARCWLGGLDIGDWMVRQGHAVAYRTYSEDYAAAEEAARRAGAGLWQGAFVLPSDYRAQARDAAQTAAQTATASEGPDGCTIKGNINARGDRIYHLPGSRDWAGTRIDTDRGERWFCSEAEAASAGWRAARG